MAAQGARFKVYRSGIVISMGLAACSSDLGGPLPPLAHSSATASMSGPPNQLSITDEVDGTVYTLDISSREIQMSDGRVLALDEQQTEEAVAAFSRTIGTDPVADTVVHLGYTESCPGQQECITPYSSTSGPTTLLWRESRSRSFEHRKQKRLKTEVGASSAVSFAGTSGASANPSLYYGLELFFASLTSGGKCSDIANIAVSSVTEYANHRTSFIREIWPYAAEVVNSAKRFIPYGSSVAAAWEEKVAQHYVTSTAVNILAFAWNSYSCSTQTVTAGPIYIGGGNTGGTSGHWACEDERWQISFDGGQTWTSVWVKVCYYTT